MILQPIAESLLLAPYYATCPDEMTGLLEKELVALGATAVQADYRVVYFSATPEVAYRAHFSLRTASRLCRVLKEIPAQSPRIVFDKARKIRFDQLFAPELPVSIRVFSANDGGSLSTDLLGSKLREAMADCFQFHLKRTPNPSSWNAKLGLSGFYRRRHLLVSLDTSGESLHRRGFRVEGHEAPLKETLAAALLAVCEYDGTVPFFDPMCGSGTIAIEAALIAQNRMPLIHRAKGGFGLEALKDFDPRLWKQVRHAAKTAERPAPALIWASDIDGRAVAITRQAVENAQLTDTIRLDKKDFFKTQRPAEKGLLIANIPYGLRLDDRPIDAAYLRALGDHLKQNFQGWRCGILAPTSAPLKEIGLRPQKQAAFLNGTVPVKLLVFDIY